MKYNKEKLEQHIEELTNMTMYVGDEIVWEGQCGQSDHFDKHFVNFLLFSFNQFVNNNKRGLIQI